MYRFAIKLLKSVSIAFLLGGGLFVAVGASAAYLGPQTIATKSVGSDLTVSEFNAVLDVSKRMFADDTANPNLYLGPTTAPAQTGPGGSCPTGYDFYDFNANSEYDAGECWKGLTIVDGEVGIGQAAPTEALDVVGNVKLTGGFIDGFVATAIPLGESGQTALSGFTATSIVGALNEVGSSISTNSSNIATNASNITDIYGTLSGNLNTISNMSSLGIVQTNASGVVTTSLTLPSGTLATTQSTNDNSTSVATTAYVDTAMGGISSDQIIEGDTKVETIDTGVDGHIVFETEATEAMRIDEAGHVGIGGVADPLAMLHINGTPGSIDQGIVFGDGDTGVYETSDDNLYFSFPGGSGWTMSANFLGASGSRGGIRWGTPTATTPVLVPLYSDVNTGIGHARTNQLSLVAGAVEGQRISEGNSRVSTVLSGTVVETITDGSTTAAAATLTKAAENFLTTVNVGDAVVIYGGTTAADYGTYIVTSVDLDTQITVDRNISVTNTDVDFDIISKGVVVENSVQDGVANIHSNKLVLDEALTHGNTTGLWFGDGDSGFYESADDTLLLTLASSPRFYFSGNIMGGSGTTSGAIINEGPSTTNPTLVPAKNDLDTGLGLAAADQLSLIAGGVEQLRLTQNGAADDEAYFTGRVGIGTASPSSIFEINEDGSGTTPNVRISNYNTSNGNSAQLSFRTTDTVADDKDYASVRAIFSDHTDGSEKGELTFSTRNGIDITERMRIDETGNVGIGTTSPNSKLQLEGSFAVKRTATATSASTDDEVIIGVTDTSVARTITLSTADAVAGRMIIIKDESGAAGTNNITIDTEGAELIDGAASVTISANYGVLRAYSNGTDWFAF